MAIFQWLSTFIRRMMRDWSGRYRPERHYMRGAGPASKRSRARPKADPTSSGKAGLDRGSAQPVSREPRACRAFRRLARNPEGSRVCLASWLWSSQIFCDSATEVS